MSEHDNSKDGLGKVAVAAIISVRVAEQAP